MKPRTAKLLLALLVPLIALCLCSAPAAAKRARLKVNGVELACQVRGQGPPLLLIMGYAGTMEAWSPRLLEALARDFTLILYDHRGMGRSAKWSKPVSLEMLAKDACGVLKVLGYERANVLGWSMGSMIAQEMALARPEMVEKLILYGTVYNNIPVKKALRKMGRATPKEFKAMMFPADWLKQHPDIFQRLPHPTAKSDPAAIAAQAQAMIRWQGTKERLGRIAMPTLIVSGEADNVTPPGQALRMAKLIPGAWLARFKAGGHWLMYQNPLGLARLVKAFLRIRENMLGPGARLGDEALAAKAA